jgi:elongation factor Ts
LPLDGVTVGDKVLDMVGKIGEKIEITRYEVIEAPKVIIYIHPGNKVVSMVGLSSANASGDAGKDVAMQIAAMNPVSIDKDDVDAKTLEREIEIGKEQARAEGKPENMIEKIAMGKLNKFYQECTLLNQSFIKDDKRTIRQYLDDTEKGLTVKVFRRVQIG